MDYIRFYYYDLDFYEKVDKKKKPYDPKTFISTLLKETSNKKIYYDERKNGDKVCIHLQEYKDDEVRNGDYVLNGKLIRIRNPENYNTEKDGNFQKMKIAGGTGLIDVAIDITYFQILFNNGKYLLTMETTPRALGVGGLRYYIENRLKKEKGLNIEVETPQNLGKDLIKIIKKNKSRHLSLAYVRFKKNIAEDDYKNIGKFGTKVKSLADEAEAEAEIRLIFNKEKVSVEKALDIIAGVKGINNININQFGELFQSLRFELEEEETKGENGVKIKQKKDKINFLDKVLQYEFNEKTKKDLNINKWETIYKYLYTNFNLKKDDGKFN